MDRRTYDAYQQCDDPELGPKLRELVTINTVAANDERYARLPLLSNGCAFLADGLCSIQSRLGEAYLSNMCARYPRVMNRVDGVVQRSLDLSCPEAARMVLLDPEPMLFEDDNSAEDDSRGVDPPELRSGEANTPKPYGFYREIRGFVIGLLQYRAFPLWKRVAILASFCDELQRMGEAGQIAQAPKLVGGFQEAVGRDLFGPGLEKTQPHHARQLELAAECILARIKADFTAPRFLACYQELLEGIGWKPESAMGDIARRYGEASRQYYGPFLSGHEFMLEHYLVSYVFRTLFPLGAQNRDAGADRPVRDECFLLLAYYGVVQTLLIGAASFYKSEMGSGQAVRVIQSFVKAFEHSLTFPGQILEILQKAGFDTCIRLALLWRT